MSSRKMEASRIHREEAYPTESKKKLGLGDNPLSTDEVLEKKFFGQDESLPDIKKDKPTHYKVISVSLYVEDIRRLEEMVAELKRRGHTKANRSQLIRFALDTVDLDALPRSY